MGYTHYWNFKNEVAPKDIKDGKKKFKTAVELFKKGLALKDGKVTANRCIYNDDWSLKEIREEEVDLVLGGWDGTGTPTITDTKIIFNGVPGYETFAISLYGGGWSFCKTNELPYDFAVCLALLCFKKAFGEDFTFTSDGDIRKGEGYWGQAKETFNQCITLV